MTLKLNSYNLQINTRMNVLKKENKNTIKNEEKKLTQKISVMHCFDNNYVIPACVSMYSMLLNANTNNFYKLYVLHSDITFQNQQILFDIVNKFENAELIFVDMNNRFEEIWADREINGHYSKEVLYKLLAPSIFPNEEKLIITDVDVVFLGDISESINYITDDKLIAGTKHIMPKNSFLEDFYQNYVDSFDDESVLENFKVCGGFLVFNLKKMREQNSEAKFVKFLIQNSEKLFQAEQDVINFCTNELEIAHLPLEYVICSYTYDLFDNEERLLEDHHYTSSEIKHAMKNPIQYHYATSIKPWNVPECTGAEIWYDYLERSGAGKHFYSLKKSNLEDENEFISENIPNVNFLNNNNLNDIEISVIIGTYNHKNFIENAINGVLNQNIDVKYEIIIADDCSTDGTKNIIEDYALKYPDKIVKIIQNKNIGIGKNYFEAYSKVRGKYVAICDGDDCWIDINKLKKQYEFLKNNADYAVCCSSFKINNENEPSKNSIFYIDDYIEEIIGIKDYYNLEDVLRCRFVASCTVMFSWKLYQFFPEFIKFYNVVDFPLLLIHSAFGKIKTFNEEIFSQYNVHSNGITLNTDSEKFNRTYISLIKEVNQFLEFRKSKVFFDFLNPQEDLDDEIDENISEVIKHKKESIFKIIYRQCVPLIIQRIYRKFKRICKKLLKAENNYGES